MLQVGATQDPSYLVTPQLHCSEINDIISSDNIF